MRKIRGFENAKMFRPGYAIEYDYFPPMQLRASLETRLVKNLFFAGQINGTTGYEEAASQGLMAGINAYLAIKEEDPFILKRSEAYIGVLIDDLITKGTEEPYRMFTSRAEYRILLRQDNADVRLTPIAHKMGIRGTEERMEVTQTKIDHAKEIEQFFRKTSVTPDQLNGFLKEKGSSPLKQSQKLHGVVIRPHINIEGLRTVLPAVEEFISKYPNYTVEMAEITMKYEGYIKKEKEMVEKMNRLESVKLKEDFDYQAINSLSSEAREKLAQLKPHTIGQASRISGVSPADVSVLLVHMGR